MRNDQIDGVANFLEGLVDIVLGVSMTPTTVRMVLVEGEKADGITVDHDVFDITASDGSANSTAAEQVIAAVLGTRESAEAGGHHLKAVGVAWNDHTEAAALRDGLTARGIEDVMLVSDGHAAAALAQAVGRAVGYASTALLFVDRDTATLSVVQTDDGSVVKVLNRSLHSSDAMAVLTEMAAAVDSQESPPQGMFVVGSGVDVSSVKSHLENLVSLPVSAPEEPELALARGAALASAHAPAFEASTVGLAYSQDPDDGTTAGSAYAAMAAAATQIAPVGSEPAATAEPETTGVRPVEEGRKPFLLVGSALTSIFVVGVVALVISLAVSIRPTVDQRPAPGQNAIVPSVPVPAPLPPAPTAQPVEQVPPPPAETIKPPVPVVQQAPQAPAPAPAPRTVYVEQPAAPAPAPAPAPAAPPPPPPPAAPVPVPVLPAPVINLPPPVIELPRPVIQLPPIFQRPSNDDYDDDRPSRPSWPWDPPKRDEPDTPNWPQPQQPERPQQPETPSNPFWPPSNGSGSDSGNGRGSSSDSGGGRGSDNGNGRGGSDNGNGRGGSSGDDGGSGGDSPLWPFPFGGGGRN